MARERLMGYLLIPLIPPMIALERNRGAGGMTVNYWQGFAVSYSYSLFGLAALSVLAAPLLFCFFRLGWTGFLPFMAGGGLCAGLTWFE